MIKTSGTSKNAADQLVKGIRRKTRTQDPTKEKISIVLAGLRGDGCPSEPIADQIRPNMTQIKSCSWVRPLRRLNSEQAQTKFG